MVFFCHSSGKLWWEAQRHWQLVGTPSDNAACMEIGVYSLNHVYKGMFCRMIINNPSVWNWVQLKVKKLAQHRKIYVSLHSKEPISKLISKSGKCKNFTRRQGLWTFSFLQSLAPNIDLSISVLVLLICLSHGIEKSTHAYTSNRHLTACLCMLNSAVGFSKI